MKNKKIFGILILLVLVFSISSLVSAESEGQLISLSLVNQDPDPAVAGETVEVRIGVENRGGDAAENLVVEILPEYPFSMVPGEDAIQDIGTITAYQTGDNQKIVKFNLRVDRDATEGQYSLKVLEYAEGRRDFGVQRTVSIDVENKESAEIIYIDKVDLIPGQRTSLTFTINNVGSAPLRDMTFSWSNEDEVILPVGSDDTKYIKYLDVGDSVELSYDVIADTNADAGLYKLELSLSYDDPSTGETTEIATNAGIYVGGITDFDVAFSESSGGEIAFSIANIGSNPATSVSVVIPKQDAWKVSGSNSVIIGNLNKGDYTLASFTLMPGRVSDGNSDITLQIAYTDTMGQRHTVEKTVELGSSALMSGDSTDATAMYPGARMKSQPTQSNTTLYIWITVIVVVAIVGFVFWRRHKNKKKH